ncbi:MAG: spore coat protein [Bacilli bacterium]|nr:spore coat protein [Bacilli bacterium]
MKIQNKQTEVPQNVNLNDKDYMNRLLGTLKELVTNYAVILNEVSNNSLYLKYKKQFDIFSECQRTTFEIMFQNGWYQLESVDKKKIDAKYNMLAKEFAGLNCEE